MNGNSDKNLFTSVISSTLPDGMYYEVTFNGDKNEWYLDAYKKFENKVLKGEQK